MPYAPVNGIELYYESHGTGPAVLFAHGVGGNHLSWWQQTPAFRGRYRCITFDHRAFGRSHDLPNGPGRTQFAADAAALMDQLGIERFFVVAQSMGGRTAGGLLYRCPERLLGVVFAGSTGGSVDDGVRELQRLHRASLPAGQSQLDRALSPRFAAARPDMVFLYRAIRRLNPKRPADFLAPRPGYTGSFSEVLGRAGVPIQYLAGEHDAITPAPIVERAAGLVQGARFSCIADAGHSAYFENPAAFNAVVRAFIDPIAARLSAA